MLLMFLNVIEESITGSTLPSSHSILLWLILKQNSITNRESPNFFVSLEHFKPDSANAYHAR